jgi:hypothetical protein
MQPTLENGSGLIFRLLQDHLPAHIGVLYLEPREAAKFALVDHYTGTLFTYFPLFTIQY